MTRMVTATKDVEHDETRYVIQTRLMESRYEAIKVQR